MTDRHLFWLDAEHKFDLAYDRHQWMLRRARGADRRTGKQGFTPVWFVGQKRVTLLEGFKRHGVDLTPEAWRLFDGLPETFTRFRLEVWQPDGEGGYWHVGWPTKPLRTARGGVRERDLTPADTIKPPAGGESRSRTPPSRIYEATDAPPPASDEGPWRRR